MIDSFPLAEEIKTQIAVKTAVPANPPIQNIFVPPNILERESDDKGNFAEYMFAARCFAYGHIPCKAPNHCIYDWTVQENGVISRYQIKFIGSQQRDADNSINVSLECEGKGGYYTAEDIDFMLVVCMIDVEQFPRFIRIPIEDFGTRKSMKICLNDTVRNKSQTCWLPYRW